MEPLDLDAENRAPGIGNKPLTRKVRPDKLVR
jgi:hypothetical protein